MSLKITLNIPEPIYRALEKAAYMQGLSIESSIRNIVRTYTNLLYDIETFYRFKYERVVEETRRLIKAALGRDIGILEAKETASSLGKLVTLLTDTYGYVPRELRLDGLRAEDLERITKVARKITGKDRVNPVEYVLDRIKEIRDVAKAFGIFIVEEGGVIKAVRFYNINLLAMYYGYGTRFLRRRIAAPMIEMRRRTPCREVTPSEEYVGGEDMGDPSRCIRVAASEVMSDEVTYSRIQDVSRILNVSIEDYIIHILEWFVNLMAPIDEYYMRRYA